MPHRAIRSRRIGGITSVVTLVAAGAIALGGAPASAAGSTRLIDGWRSAPETAVVQVSALLVPDARPRAARGIGADVAEPAGGDPCADRGHSYTSDPATRWKQSFKWTFHAGTTPANLSRVATAKALKRAIANITGSHNDCGRADRVSATAVYLGVADWKPGPTEAGRCAPRDNHNAIGFGRLPSGIAGLTCVWSIGDEIVEADIKLDRRADWATSLDTCSFESMVEAVATHEFGHAFGLGHVKEATHGRLTMSERLDGYCQNGESTLGLGDMLGLEGIY